MARKSVEMMSENKVLGLTLFKILSENVIKLVFKKNVWFYIGYRV